MRIDNIEIRPYLLRFKGVPLQPKKGAHLLLSIGDKVITADLSPLPGWSKETLAEAIEELTSLQHIALEDALLRAKWPSVQFVLTYAYYHQTRPLIRKPQEKCLLYFPHAQLIETYRRDHALGFRYFKLKLKDLTPEGAHRLIDQFSLPDTRLRLDLNRAWSPQEIISLAHQLNPTFVDFIEEPTASPFELPELPIPIALDESLRRTSFEQLLSTVHFDTVVIKPTMQPHMVALMKQARKAEKNIVLSSSFESDVGLDMIAELALYEHISTPLGIDTKRYHDMSHPALV